MANDSAAPYPGKELEAMSFAVNYHRWILDEFESYFGETTAEVGAGIGSVSRLILGRGVTRLYAFEPSPNMFPLLEKELRCDEGAQAVNDCFSPKYVQSGVDSIAYINVMEHIQDDRAEFALAHEALRANGHLLLFVPALPWLYSDFDKQLGHFRRYTMKGVTGLLKDAGFSLVTARYFDLAGIIPWYVNFVLLRRSLGHRGVSAYDRLVVPLMRRVESRLVPPLGKNLLIVARK